MTRRMRRICARFRMSRAVFRHVTTEQNGVIDFSPHFFLSVYGTLFISNCYFRFYVDRNERVSVSSIKLIVNPAIVQKTIIKKLDLFKMNTSLIFEVLLYLNSYYFGLFAVCEIGMNVVKAVNLDLPNFATDFAILVTVCILELIRVIIARKGNLSEKSWPVFVAILFTIPSAIGIIYFITWQPVVLRFEYIICAIQLGLQLAEIFFGVLCLLPFCKTPDYY